MIQQTIHVRNLMLALNAGISLLATARAMAGQDDEALPAIIMTVTSVSPAVATAPASSALRDTLVLPTRPGAPTAPPLSDGPTCPEAAASAAALRRIVVFVQDRKLVLLENGRPVHVYPVAVGKRSTPSPTGVFSIVNRLSNPAYYRSGLVIGPGVDNPLGSRWIGLSQKGIGIHGTNQPGSIGRSASHGCIRMAREDLEQLFTLVRVGDPVEIVNAADQTLDFAPVQAEFRRPTDRFTGLP
jgi:lipoprotein-anchoring transpeptidase ErfK/SrfK